MDYTNLTIQSYYDPDPRITGRKKLPAKSDFLYDKNLVKTYNQEFYAITWSINPQEDKSERGIKNTSHFLRIGLDVDAGKSHKDTKDQIDQGKKDILNKLRKLPLYPTYIIESKNGYQPVWEFDNPLEIKPEGREKINEDYKIAVKQLCETIGLSSEADSISRTLRLPDTYHYKDPDDPFKIKLIYEGEKVNRQEFSKIYNIDPKRDIKTDTFGKEIINLDNPLEIAQDYGWITPRIKDISESSNWTWRGSEGVGRNNLLARIFGSVCATLVKKGYSTQTAAEMCYFINSQLQDPLDKGEVESIIRHKLNYAQNIKEEIKDGWFPS